MTRESAKTINRDLLAVERTKLANDRTFLAHLRTSLMFFVSGITIAKLFSDGIWLKLASSSFLFLALVFIILGIIVFKKTGQDIKKIISSRD